MSSPPLSYSSPCRRSPRVLSASTPGPSAGGAHRPNLSRRWSLDNISSQREGYVRDLRRQHQRDRIEVYPFMLTERHNLRQNRDVGDSSKSMTTFFSPAMTAGDRRHSTCRTPSSPSKMSAGCRRTRSFSLDINEEMNVVRGRHRIAMSATASAIPPVRHFGLSYSSSVDISSTTVPEDTELQCINPVDYDANRAPEIPTGYHRKRSSSLPRILPPILDDDDDEEGAVNDGHHRKDQTSGLIVREMQKFVCRQADDVSLVLPLPLPSRRQSKLADKTEDKETRWRRGARFDSRHIRVLLRAVAKIHACSFAIRCKSPRLFDEMCSSLESSNLHFQPPTKRFLTMDREALAEAIKTTPLVTEATPENETNDILALLYRQFEELHSTSTKPFPVIVHGDIRPENVTFTPGDTPADEPKETKLSGLRCSIVGSPLIDLYSVFFNCANAEARSLDPLNFLAPYFAAFIDVSNHLRVRVNDFQLESLVSDFKRYELAGALCAAASDEQCSVADKQCLANKMRNLSLDIPCEIPSIK